LDNALENTIATVIEISRRHAIIETNLIVQNAPFSSASIIRLPPLPETTESAIDGAEAETEEGSALAP
jgi:hypothetical protein